MGALDKKLIRDLKHLWAQALAIAFVMSAGVATLLLAVGAYRSLYETREAYYERYRFADVFATAKRAPNALMRQIVEVPGVATAEARISGAALLDIPGLIEPATGLILSLPDSGEPKLNGVYIRSGRFPDPQRDDEVIVSDAFAKANRLRPGSKIKAILYGRKRELTIVGIGLSPEHIYSIGPGDIVPDNRRFGILWMPYHAASAAFDLDGAFNSLSLRLLRDASVEDVIDQVDSLLNRYGGTGAYARKDQTSHAFIDAELKQLKGMSRILPPIFLLVSAFLINMTLARLIAMEREQIGLFKALGYSAWPIAAHYFKFVLIIAGTGVLIGFVAGAWLGRGMTKLYGDFFHFPFLYFSNDQDLYVISGGVTIGAALLGALWAVYRAISLPPAVAMAPPTPARYRQSWIERSALAPRFSQLSMMVIRHLLRWPGRAFLTSFGVALSAAILLVSFAMNDSIEYMIDVTWFQSDRQQATLTFSEKERSPIVQDVLHLPGVQTAEPYRAVPIRIRYGHRSRRTSIIGKPPNTDLNRILDLSLRPIDLSETGIGLTEMLANLLHVKLGDVVQVEVLEGRRAKINVPVTQIVQSYLGINAFMDLESLNRLLLESDIVTGVHLAFDENKETVLYDKVKSVPSVSGIALQRESLEMFRATIAKNILIMITVYLTLASVIAFGVVYNSARIRLSERGRELASLRVLGFTKSEIYWVLFAEFAVLTLAAIPLGWLIGIGLNVLITNSLASELYRIPFMIERDTYALAALVVIAAALISAVVIRRRVNRLDLISVLKTRE